MIVVSTPWDLGIQKYQSSAHTPLLSNNRLQKIIIDIFSFRLQAMWEFISQIPLLDGDYKLSWMTVHWSGYN